MIFLTGDTHIPIDIKKLNTKNFPKQNKMTKDDYVIILGDFGGIWDGSNEEQYWLNWLNNKNFTTLFIDGNHENFDLLYQYRQIQWHGGLIRCIKDSVLHLNRGDCFLLDGLKILTIGGAKSTDKEHRIKGKSWWEEEELTYIEMEYIDNTMKTNNYSFDIILSHCAPYSLNPYQRSDFIDKTSNYLEYVKNLCTYNKWYFGHYHLDKNIDKKHTVVYDNIIQIK